MLILGAQGQKTCLLKNKAQIKEIEPVKTDRFGCGFAPDFGARFSQRTENHTYLSTTRTQ